MENMVEEKIKEIIKNKIDPVLKEHFGGAELVEIRDNVVYVKLLGACGGCPSSQITLENIIESSIKEEMPEIERVSLYQGVSDEMMDFAKELIKKERQK